MRAVSSACLLSSTDPSRSTGGACGGRESARGSHADATAEALGIHRDAAQSISDERTKLQEDTAARLVEETSAAEARISDEKASARETIPEVAGEVTRAAVERLIGVEVAEADAKSAVEAAMRGGA